MKRVVSAVVAVEMIIRGLNVVSSAAVIPARDRASVTAASLEILFVIRLSFEEHADNAAMGRARYTAPISDVISRPETTAARSWCSESSVYGVVPNWRIAISG